MQQSEIIHRDLKPDNVLLNSGEEKVYDVRIADFGFAIRGNDEEQLKSSQKYIYGTPCYIPPEALKGLSYNMKSDIFSIGSIMFNILTRKQLFFGNTEN